jgi:hypothetical protein
LPSWPSIRMTLKTFNGAQYVSADKELIQQVIEHYASLLEKLECKALSTFSSFTPREPLTRTTSPASQIRRPSCRHPPNLLQTQLSIFETGFARSCENGRASPCTPTIKATPASAASLRRNDEFRRSGPSSSISPATTIFRVYPCRRPKTGSSLSVPWDSSCRVVDHANPLSNRTTSRASFRSHAPIASRTSFHGIPWEIPTAIAARAFVTLC